ncbi:TraU family protein [Comamonas thiooxydans]|uniref:TraU family protein n=1 Tax=Comamonas thiooxydans TaxID=363952 RepID=UPI000B409DF9|nr:TraU family protein [Comamonas thiooxydans]
MNLIKKISKWLGASLLALAATTSMAAPGCVGKMWNPLQDLDYRLMGGIKIMGMKIMDNPSELGEPPEHKAKTICFCKDGLQTGFGMGFTFWLPSYINDMARQGGCLGFLNGTNIASSFISLSSGQEYSMHPFGREGATTMQVHWAYADVMSIAGSSLFEKCNATSGGMMISHMTEFDFIFQSDVYSVILTPQAAILAASPILAMMTCGYENIANTLGDWQDWGVCAWNGSRFPLSGSSISKNSAQVTNMDITVKYLTRSAMLGTTLRTMGSDAMCRPQYSPFYDPFQHRYQWSFPGKVATRYNIDMVRWGMFIKDAGQGNMMALADQASSLGGVSATGGDPATPGQLGLAEKIVKSLPKPLNYPTKEAGYMQVWEARQCCLVVLTIQKLLEMVVANVAAMDPLLKQMYDLYNTVNTVYEVVQDPIGAALGFIGDGIAKGLETVGGALSSGLADVASGVSNSLS